MLISHRKFYQIAFFLAGIYNICWGIYVCIDPQWFFRFSGLAELNHPEIFMCMGMVIGLYGVLYLEVARVPEKNWLIIVVGLAGKVFGPIGAISLIYQDVWPIRSILLCVTNDFIWWIPFGLYLFDSWRLRKYHGVRRTNKNPIE